MFKRVVKQINQTLKILRRLIFGWGIIIPLTWLLPVKKNLVVFIGKNKGLFFDNVKYLYLYLHSLKRNDIEYYFITEKKSVYNLLKQHNLPVLLHPTLRSKYVMFCANVTIICCTWNKRVSFRAKMIQLWHGVPLRKIGMLTPSETEKSGSLLERFSDAVQRKNYAYDLFISTSDYTTENIFSKAIRAKKYLEIGYSRNDLLFKEQPTELDLLESDVDSLQKINGLRKDGFKSILYAPTGNDWSENPVTSGHLRLDALSKFAQQHKLLFVFKFHPAIADAAEFGRFDNIIYYNKVKDIQPLLRITDLLITDYSSVYLDYLLLDRPVIFFPYNYDRYMQTQQGLIFDYDSMTPGPICRTQQQLEDAITHTLDHPDEFAGKREEIKKLVFKYDDGKASERIWNFIMKEYIEPF